jgi:Skp family chaperone for outer membrane proteins
VEDHSDERRLMKKILVVVCVLFSVVIGLSIAWSGEKEDLSWKARAIVAEFKDASNKLNDANEVFTKTKEELTKFAQELDAKGLSLQMDGKIVDKPKPQPQPPEKKVEPPKK